MLPVALCGSPLSGTEPRSATNSRSPAGERSTRSGAGSALTPPARSTVFTHLPERSVDDLGHVGVPIHHPQIAVADGSAIPCESDIPVLLSTSVGAGLLGALNAEYPDSGNR